MVAFGNPVAGLIRPPGSPFIVGSFRVTSTFAEHVASGRGAGIDIGNGRCNDPILAMASGRVSLAGLIGAAKVVRIVHPQYPGYETGYAHLATIEVTLGQIVSKGQRIGTLGTTGASACHLHGGCKVNGVEIDWWPLLIQNGAQEDEDMLQGANPRPIENRKVATATGGDDPRFRARPFLKPDNILASLPNGTELHPDYIVDGTRIGATADPRWYGAWATTPKGIEFGYVSVVFTTPALLIELVGVPQAKYDADVKAARAKGISDAATNAAATK